MDIYDNFAFDKNEKPYKVLSYLYNEINKIEESINFYMTEINDLNNNHYKDYFENYSEVDPILELVTETMSLDSYIKILENLKTKADPNETVIIKPSNELKDKYQRSTIIIPLPKPDKENFKQRILELKHLIKNLEEKKSLIFIEIEKIKTKKEL